MQPSAEIAFCFLGYRIVGSRHQQSLHRQPSVMLLCAAASLVCDALIHQQQQKKLHRKNEKVGIYVVGVVKEKNTTALRFHTEIHLLIHTDLLYTLWSTLSNRFSRTI
jgi:hypothetical protein